MPIESPWSRRDGFTHGNQDVLTRWGYRACAIAWIIFIFYEVFIYLDCHYSPAPLCAFSDAEFHPWYFHSMFASMGGLFMTTMLLTVKIWIQFVKNPETRVPLFVAWNVVFMSLVANVLTLVMTSWDLGGICIDALNVASIAPLWGEWISCGPLLIFMTVSIAHKAELTNMDVFMMISFFVCLVCGFLIIVPSDYRVGQFWFAMSCIAYLPLSHLLVYDRYNKVGQEIAMMNSVGMQRLQKRQQIMLWLSFVFPLYTLTYLLGLFGCITYAQTIVIYQLLSVTTKGLFAAVTMDLHVDLLRKAERALQTEKNANEARRDFMKYLFHEVRTPLNSITMGIDMLKLTNGLDEEERSYLVMMTGATDFMTDTLNNVLNMHKIEEGKLILEIAPFLLLVAVQKVLAAAHGAVMSKRIKIDLNISDKIPKKVTGNTTHPFDLFQPLHPPTPTNQISLPTCPINTSSHIPPSPSTLSTHRNFPSSLPTHPHNPPSLPIHPPYQPTLTIHPPYQSTLTTHPPYQSTLTTHPPYSLPTRPHNPPSLPTHHPNNSSAVIAST